MNTTEQIVLNALASMADASGEIKISQLKLSEVTGRGQSAISCAVRSLEAKGHLGIARGANRLQPATYAVHTLSTAKAVKTNGGAVDSLSTTSEGLPDFLRARDLTGPGWLWMRAPKGAALPLLDVAEFAVVRTLASVRRHLAKLEELGLVSVMLDPNLKSRNLYVFREPSDEEQLSIIAAVNERADGYRIKTRAEREEENQRRRDALYHLRTSTQLSYVELVPSLWENCIPDPGGCLIYAGELDRGYAVVPGVTWKGIKGHRVVYIATYGAVLDGYQVHHVCERRNCLNVHHLVAVTGEQHNWITRHQGRRGGFRMVCECEHGVRVPVGPVPLPPDLFPHGECELALTSYVLAS
ncbi:HNH endonuclease [Sinomonas gamaensis]|uniref:HNH endonuclease n=1 Tax=Sinomonas gamaensis TaxID=2565624 RepID=UPI0014870C27|nr:HNH endonuclease [Sinomonas gamaensis]